MVKFSKIKSQRFAVVLVTGLVGVGILLLALAEFHEEVEEPFLIGLDLQIQAIMHGYSSPGLTRIMLALTWIGSPGLLFPSTALLAASLWWRRAHRDATTFLTAMTGAAILIVVLKLYFHRIRPDVSWALVEEHSFSFPSGHSIAAVVLYGILVCSGFQYWRQAWQRTALAVTAVGLMLGIGMSRIYLGAHYPSDVAAGYLVGCCWLATVLVANLELQRMEPQDDSRQDRTDALTPSL